MKSTEHPGQRGKEMPRRVGTGNTQQRGKEMPRRVGTHTVTLRDLAHFERLRPRRSNLVPHPRSPRSTLI